MAEEATKTVRKASQGNGKKPTKVAKTQRAAPLTLTEIEHLAGQPIDFSAIYTKTDEPVRRKLFAVAAAQQLRDFVNRARAKGALEPAEIQSWVPVMKRRGIGAVNKAAKIVSVMTPEERAELVKMLNG